MLSVIFFGSSCISNGYFHSPVQGSNTAYHAMPVASDSVKSAIYASAALHIGGSNEALRDGVYGFQAGIHRSHVLEDFRVNYGASVLLGAYHIAGYQDYNTGFMSPVVQNGAYTKFFGSYGAFGGISAAKPMGRKGEWRYIGLEGGLFNEFGSYYHFRKSLPDSAADLIDRKKYMGALGINTEFVFKPRAQKKIGIKIAFGSYLRQLRYNDAYSGNYYNRRYSDLLYFSNTYHLTIRQTTGYFQFNAATHSANFSIGVNYRL